jgi:uncharacterized protein (UPF0332 family)
VTIRSDAEGHLRKAKEFLEAARNSLEFELHNAAASDAVVAGINAKDSICLSLAGRTNKTDDHNAGVAELKAVGKVGRDLAPTLSRLLRLKTKSQYQSIAVGAADAKKAIEWAQRMVDSAAAVLAG